MNAHWKSALAAGALCVSASAATAASVTIESVTGAWLNVTGGNNVTVDGDRASWGSDTARSGYMFEAATQAGPHNVGDVFNLGDFVHENRPIPVGSGIKSAQLELSFSLKLEDKVTGMFEIVSLTSLFDFAHLETNNSRNKCENGGDNNVGINLGGCADLVTARSNPTGTATGTLGDRAFQINISSFLVDGETMDEFWTQEDETNRAQLQGRFEIAEMPTPVPLPAAGWMLMSALAGLGYAGRRRLSRK